MNHFLLRCLRRLGFSGLRPSFEIYTDGGLKQGIGSWAFVVVQKDVVIHEASGWVKRTDCNRMEFRAAVEALRWLPDSSRVILYSDSRILVDTLNQWRHVWKAAGWVRERRRTIHNLDYLRQLDSLSERHSVVWKWVRAHSGLAYNERCDRLCARVRTAALRQEKALT